MNLDLTHVRAKLARAQEHRQAIKNEIGTWIDRAPYSVTTEANADCTRYSIILRVNEPATLQRWTLMFSDCLNNIRAALDYLVYAIACREAAPNPPSDEGTLAFPITDCSTKFNEAVSRRRLGNISAPVRAAIERVQPYNRPHKELPPLLAILRDLNNTDKHRLLRLAYGTVASGNIGFVGDFPKDAVWKDVTHSGEVEDGTEIFAMICDRPAPDMKYDRTLFDVIIAVSHAKRDPAAPEWTGRSEVCGLLTYLITDARQVIYSIASVVK